MKETEQLIEDYNPGWNLHEKFMHWSVQILAPIVFNCGLKKETWNMKTGDLLKFPDGSLGNELGKFYRKERLKPIANAEFHDAFHVIFGFSTSIKDELALQFLLWGNGKTSLALIGTATGSWFIFPRQWRYFVASYKRGKQFVDVSTLDLKTLLDEDLEKLKTSILKYRVIHPLK